MSGAPGSPARNPEPVAAEQPVLAFRNVSIAFANPVLEDVTFSVAPGETRILLGPAGVGKSVLLKLALGLLRPDRGSIRLFGQEIGDMPEQKMFPLRTRSGIVFQEGALFDSLSIRNNVGYQFIQDRASDDEIDGRVREILSFVGLEDTFALFPSSLSGGMRRRVAIARALIHSPDLVLYDSPTGGLDPVTSTTIIELIMKQRDVHRTPSIIVTHRLQDAFALCTHRFDSSAGHMAPIPDGQTDAGTTFLMLDGGRLSFDGSLHELVHSESPFVREFLE